MRIATLFGLVGLFIIQWDSDTYQVADNSCDCRDLQQPGDQCQNRSGAADPTISIDDSAVQRTLEEAGGALIERGTGTKIEALVKQLGIERCQLDLAQPTAAPENEPQMYLRAKRSVVIVSSVYKCQKCEHWHATTATGFVISSSGAVATNYHVINNPDKEIIVVMTADGQVLPVRRVLAASRGDDLAIVQVDAEGLVPLPIATAAEPVASRIGVISHPSQRFYCYTNGIVSRYMKMKPNNEVVDGMTITADYARGSSGAPVLNMNGEVVGIVQSTNSIYYSVERGRQKNLQMVFKRCIPAASLLRLIAHTSDTVEPKADNLGASAGTTSGNAIPPLRSSREPFPEICGRRGPGLATQPAAQRHPSVPSHPVVLRFSFVAAALLAEPIPLAVQRFRIGSYPASFIAANPV